MQNHRNRIAQRFKVIFANVTPADLHTAAGYIVKAGYHLHKSGFGRTGSADYADSLAGFYIHCNVVKTKLVGGFGVVEIDMVKAYAAVGNGFHRVFTIGKVAFFVKHLADTLRALTRNGGHNKHHRQHHNAHQNLHCVGDKAHQAAGGKPARHSRVAAAGNDCLCAEP